MDFYLDTTTVEDESVRTALILAKTRYDKTLAPFVGASTSRLAFVDDRIERIVVSCAEQAKADVDVVRRKFAELIKETLYGLDGPNPEPMEQVCPDCGNPVNDMGDGWSYCPKCKQKVREGDGEPIRERMAADAVSEPERVNITMDADPYQNVEEVPEKGTTGVEHTDIKDLSPVLDSREPDARVELPKHELGQPTQVSYSKIGDSDDCVVCGTKLNPVVAQYTIACEPCTKVVLGMGEPVSQDPASAGLNCQNPTNCQAVNGQCSYPGCGGAGVPMDPMVASKEAAGGHVISCDEMDCPGVPLGIEFDCQTCGKHFSPAEEDGGDFEPFEPQKKMLDPMHVSAADDTNKIFDDIVYKMANEMAALRWSQISDQDVLEIAQQYGIDEEMVRQNLRIVTRFGDAVASNGELGEPEIDTLNELPDFGGRVPAEQVEVPLEDAIATTASQSGADHQAIYQQIQESYYGELSDNYTLSVTGTAQYFLPQEVMNAEQPHEIAPEVPTPPGGMETAPGAMSPQLSSFLKKNAEFFKGGADDEEELQDEEDDGAPNAFLDDALTDGDEDPIEEVLQVDDEEPALDELPEEEMDLGEAVTDDLPTEPFSAGTMTPEDVAAAMPGGWEFGGVIPREDITGESGGFLWAANNPGFFGGDAIYADTPDKLIAQITEIESARSTEGGQEVEPLPEVEMPEVPAPDDVLVI